MTFEYDKTKVSPTFKMPATLAGCADLLYKTQQARYAVQKQVAAMEADEYVLRSRIIAELPKSEATGIAGKLGRVRVENKSTVKITDFAAYVAQVASLIKKDPGAVALLQKRAGEVAVKEMWEAGKKLKGVEEYTVPVVRITKV